MVEAIIDGENFSDLGQFYDEVELKLTKGLDWKIGRNLNAFNDVLRGGFGVHEYEEPLKLKWLNASKSKNDLGWDTTIQYLKRLLENCPPHNLEYLENELKSAEEKNGETLYDIILGIISSHEHIHFEKE